MSTAANKALVCRYWDEVVNPGNLDLIDELYAPDGDVHGPDGVRQQLAAYRAAFPDLRAEVADEIAEGEEVVQRWWPGAPTGASCSASPRPASR